MGKWIFAMTSIIIFKVGLSLDSAKSCRKRTSPLGGEELICSNASTSLLRNNDFILSKTHWFTCENCTLNTLDGTTFNFTKNSINYLYLISSQIVTIKGHAFVKMKFLKIVNLRNNSISDLDPESFTNLTRVTQVDLSHNSLRILTNNLFSELANLDLLNLNHNTVFYIQPDAFKGLSNLRHLYLSHNRLERLEGYVFKYLPNLLLLYLEHNRIISIDSFAFANLSNLNALYLNNNSINFLTQYNFKPLNSLVDLQLRRNNLVEVQTSAFNGLTNLKHLYLGNNRLRTVKRYGFVGLDNLQNLDLIGNDLKHFDLSHVESLRKLNMLWLEQNRLTNLSIDVKLEPLNSLYSLGINDNNLTVLNYKLLYNKMPNIRDIFIYNNSWNCELLISMQQFFQELNVSLCMSFDCNPEKNKHVLEASSCDVRLKEEESDEDFDADFVAEAGTCCRFSVILVLVNLQMLVFV
ncbi:insulin-like growth factor-binding protein complex acid labile subunit [Tribolium castaneum]|uniref:Insulin-like growth factor-binding protein complex acid labile subunit n=1 Tax=Tribolium castaneum TaxID=7070 RepID=D6WZH0_TRICA|nr:PREDICTED: insulin-like growth factor-binding protein complex acid labile subunit [Tribolium castaneum]EFA09704.2 Insulin-like growth factor-binding protein complex acid labile subunit [Tribolium castaneum]|eukprot:XP_008198205.1 PREDICTED: insulin-like growth factor-binding protein complex acid labile subunit [Tribolium castaneum]